jgi:hypothetical protein
VTPCDDLNWLAHSLSSGAWNVEPAPLIVPLSCAPLLEPESDVVLVLPLLAVLLLSSLLPHAAKPSARAPAAAAARILVYLM